jgi:uncharacterized protein YraI
MVPLGSGEGDDMRKLVMALVALVGGLLLPAAAEAADGFTTGDVNMRAGPGTQYPRIMVLPRGAPVEIYGCLRGYSWCDVGYYRERGWVSSRYLSVFYDDRRVYVPYRPRVTVPYLTFEFNYWDRWYNDRPWYREWRRKYRDERPIYRNDPPPVYRNDPPPVYFEPSEPPRDRRRPRQEVIEGSNPPQDDVGGYVPGGDPTPRCPPGFPDCMDGGVAPGGPDAWVEGPGAVGPGDVGRND